MAALLKNVTNCIWQAFNSLDTDNTGTVVKSKLKVSTSVGSACTGGGSRRERTLENDQFGKVYSMRFSIIRSNSFSPGGGGQSAPPFGVCAH